MRLLSPASKRGRSFWTWWLQERRRSRWAAETPPSPLLSGLMQFYQPASGLSYVKSWNESEAVVSNPYEGFVVPTEDLGSGSYSAGDALLYQLHAYREVSGSRVYAGVAYQKEATASAASSGFDWPAWSSGPAWVTGYALLRWVNGTYSGYRIVTVRAAAGAGMALAPPAARRPASGGRGRARRAEEVAHGVRMRYADTVVREQAGGEKKVPLEYGFRRVRLPGRRDAKLTLVVVERVRPRAVVAADQRGGERNAPFGVEHLAGVSDALVGGGNDPVHQAELPVGRSAGVGL